MIFLMTESGDYQKETGEVVDYTFLSSLVESGEKVYVKLFPEGKPVEVIHVEYVNS